MKGITNSKQCSHLGCLLGPDGEVLQTTGQLVKASRLVKSAQNTVGEECALGLWVAQEQDVEHLLGCPGKGETTDVCGDEVGVVMGHSNGSAVTVDNTLVIKLQAEQL